MDDDDGDLSAWLLTRLSTDSEKEREREGEERERPREREREEVSRDQPFANQSHAQIKTRLANNIEMLRRWWRRSFHCTYLLHGHIKGLKLEPG